MESRNTRSFRAFIQQLLQADDGHQDSGVYDGVCFLNSHSGAVEYAEGSFTMNRTADASSTASLQLSVDLHDGSHSTSLLDTRQFLRVFEQITRRALQQKSDREHEEEAELTPAFHVGDAAFQLVSASFTTVCAVASGKTHALIVEKLPIGVLVVLLRHPQTLERMLPRVSRACAPLRR
ncbi:hypothetical protein Gpo141_00012680 [Globisporangium polare]